LWHCEGVHEKRKRSDEKAALIQRAAFVLILGLIPHQPKLIRDDPTFFYCKNSTIPKRQLRLCNSLAGKQIDYPMLWNFQFSRNVA
jgi:hypothetical protein